MKKEIDETGFDTGSESVKPSDLSSSNNKSPSSWVGKAVLAVIMVAGCLVVGFYFLNKPIDTPISLDDEFRGNPLQPVGQTLNLAQVDTGADNDDQIPNQPSLEMEGGKININGINNLIAEALLGNYPTNADLDERIEQVKGADVSKAELDVFLIAVTENTKKIAKLLEQAKKNQDISVATKELKKINSELKKQGVRSNKLAKEVGDMQSQVLSLVKKVDKVSKNSGWYHNRISKLEGKDVPFKRKKVTKAKKQPMQVPRPLTVRRLELNKTSEWRVKGAAEKVAFITSKNHSRPIRVTLGYDIPGCGLVTGISAADQRVYTTSCAPIEN